MADIWAFDLPMTAGEREVILARLKSIRASLSASSPLAGPLADFERQVEDGQPRIQLAMDRLDVVGKFHWSSLLETLCPENGFTRCLRCGGSGELRLPDSVMRLHASFEHTFNLWQVTGGDRDWYLNQSADPAEREKVLAVQRAEEERRRESIRRGEAASRVRTLPGTVLSEPDSDRPPAEFVPGRTKVRGAFN